MELVTRSVECATKPSAKEALSLSKLFFRYGAMNSGKSTLLLQVAHNYEERDQSVLLVKPAVDTKGNNEVVSRLGVKRRVDILLQRDDNFRTAFHAARAEHDPSRPAIACVLIDEAQFLTPEQVDQTLEVVSFDEMPVIAFGIRTDFLTQSFPGSRRLMEVAHTLEELKTICRCGRKAIFNARMNDQGMIKEGEQVMIDGGDTRSEALCAKCYLSG